MDHGSSAPFVGFAFFVVRTCVSGQTNSSEGVSRHVATAQRNSDRVWGKAAASWRRCVKRLAIRACSAPALRVQGDRYVLTKSTADGIGMSSMGGRKGMVGLP